ncbi:MAG: radical SAM family heme chaperone HemW [Lachnospiraceae bacterium]|nr:radical SAM family heme chaperone HemW [Lachnospiraceae bacterium]
MENTLGIYIHIPFCVRKCRYCDFLSMPATDEVQRAYVDELLEEIKYKAMVFNDLNGDERPVDSIYIGGGTPSILQTLDIKGIINCVKDQFQISPDAEVSMEVNPGTLYEINDPCQNYESNDSFTNNGVNKYDNSYRNEKINGWKEAGINRLSIGLQSVNNRELETLGRIHSFETFLENYNILRESGYNNINIDLISALPGQTPESWEKTLRTVADLNPEHISAYSLIIEENTPFFRLYQKDVEAKLRGDKPEELPTEEAEVRMYEMTAEVLEEYGFSRYEISNYSKPGRECRHNIRYWKRGDYLGFGIGAASLFKNKRYKNISDINEYLGLFTREEYMHYKSLYEETTELSIKDRMEELMFLGLRMSEGIDTGVFDECFGESKSSFEEYYAGIFKSLEGQGLMENYAPSKWRLTPKGVNISNYVLSFMLFD